MANEIARALAPISSARQVGGNIARSFAAGALAGQQRGAAATSRDIQADEFAISPYRRWLANFAGGKSAAAARSLAEKETNAEDLKAKLDELRESAKTGATTIPLITPEKIAQALSGTIKKGEVASRLVPELIKQLTGAAPTKEQETALKALKLRADEVMSKNVALVNLINGAAGAYNKKNAGTSLDEAIEAAEDQYTTARTTLRKELSQFNNKVAKKTELENMTGLNIRAFQGRGRAGGGVGVATLKKSMLQQIKDQLKSIRAQADKVKANQVGIQAEPGQSALLGEQIETILANAEATAGNILAAPSLEHANALRQNIMSALTPLSGIDRVPIDSWHSFIRRNRKKTFSITPEQAVSLGGFTPFQESIRAEQPTAEELGGVSPGEIEPDIDELIEE